MMVVSRSFLSAVVAAAVIAAADATFEVRHKPSGARAAGAIQDFYIWYIASSAVLFGNVQMRILQVPLQNAVDAVIGGVVNTTLHKGEIASTPARDVVSLC